MQDIARRRLGRPVVSWRSHGLIRDGNTYPILAESGITHISDDLSRDKLHPERLREGLISHPMNVIMDHDHIYHAHRTRQYVERQQKDWPFHDDPTNESYPIEAWGKLVEHQVRAIEDRGGVATVLLHPLCMYAADRFHTMERLLGVFSQFESIWASETREQL